MPRGGPGKTQATSFCKNKESDAILLSRLEQDILNGQNGDNNFQPIVFTDAARDLKDAGFASVTAAQCKTWWSRFKDYCIVKFLHELSGLFGNQKKKYKDYSKWCHTAFPEYERIAEITGVNDTTGEFASASELDNEGGSNEDLDNGKGDVEMAGTSPEANLVLDSDVDELDDNDALVGLGSSQDTNTMSALQLDNISPLALLPPLLPLVLAHL
ncbi:unnamed protein product [Peniophora sp. CBMAI 1063]|nr:unnamed protein product [Peniophora sp. CBMAI 1063]